MSEQYLHRGDAPFGDGVWEAIDSAVVGAAKSQLAGRRLLHTIGPQGLGSKVFPFGDSPVPGNTVEGVTVSSSCMIPVAMIGCDSTAIRAPTTPSPDSATSTRRVGTSRASPRSATANAAWRRNST